MQLIKAAFINEISKIFARKKVTAAVILSLLAIALGQTVTLLLNRLSGISIAGASSFPVLALSIFSYTLIPLFGIFVTVDLFAGEFSQGTMKLILSRPISRFKIYFSKVLAAGTFVFANLMFVMLVSVISSIIFSGANIDIFYIITAYVVNFIPIFVFILLCALIANITKGATGAFMLSIFAFIILFVLGILFSGAKSFLLLSYFDWFTFFTGSYLNSAKIIRTFLILSGAAVMFFSAGYYIFEKRDV